MHALLSVHNNKCTNTNSSQQKRESKHQLKYSDKVYSINSASFGEQNYVEMKVHPSKMASVICKQIL